MDPGVKKVKTKDLRSLLRLSLNKYRMKDETRLSLTFVKQGVHTMNDIGVFVQNLGVESIFTGIEVSEFIERLHRCNLSWNGFLKLVKRPPSEHYANKGEDAGLQIGSRVDKKK